MLNDTFELIREFKASFWAYVDDSRDDREQMLAAMLDMPVDKLIIFSEPHDLAAFLTYAACVDSSKANGVMDMDSQRLREIIVTDEGKPSVGKFFDGLMGSEEGEDLLRQIAFCLAHANKIAGIRTNLWSPAKR
ncbi:MAG TPA: hypothetical protein DCZ47_03245 [Candidatus Magasanikbacteria bacterium]|nr:hypothetical protein [Candidatus Magasanikbacteria bacterium]